MRSHKGKAENFHSSYREYELYNEWKIHEKCMQRTQIDMKEQNMEAAYNLKEVMNKPERLAPGRDRQRHGMPGGFFLYVPLYGI